MLVASFQSSDQAGVPMSVLSNNRCHQYVLCFFCFFPIDVPKTLLSIHCTYHMVYATVSPILGQLFPDKIGTKRPCHISIRGIVIMTTCKGIFPEPTEPKDSFCEMPLDPSTHMQQWSSTCFLHTLAHQYVTGISILNLTNLESGFLVLGHPQISRNRFPGFVQIGELCSMHGGVVLWGM